MKKTKTQKGITLIALIITIVILLILAVVTIGAVKDSKIIGHAQNASSEYTVEQEKEQIGLALGEWQIQKVIGEKSFKEVIESSLTGTALSVLPNEDGTLTVTMKTGNQYTVTDNGEVIPVQKGIILSDATLTIMQGGTKTITAIATGGLKIDNITYSSSSENIVTVTQDGVITAVAIGSATITAECDGYSATCGVTVKGEDDWTYAWTCTNGAWDETRLESGDTIDENVDIVAKFYDMGRTIPLTDFIFNERNIDLPASATEYNLIIQGSGTMGSLADDNGAYAWNVDFFNKVGGASSSDGTVTLTEPYLTASVTKVIIDGEIENIGHAAFINARSLEEIVIPDTVTTIGLSTFMGCAKISSLELPSRLTSLSENLFNGCTNLTTINIPSTVTDIGDDVFTGCTKLKTIIIDQPDSSVLGTSWIPASATDVRYVG